MELADGENIATQHLDDIDEDSVDEFVKEVDSSITPYVGQQFQDLEAAYKFYCNYALAGGFDVRKYTTKKWRDGTIKSKLLVCNRQGEIAPKSEKKDDKSDKTSEEETNELSETTETVVDVLGSPQRRCRSSRVGCKARLRIYQKKGLPVVDIFHKGHNHELITKEEREFQKDNNNLTLYHKKLIINNSRLAIGATRSYNMCKEQSDGFENVGASLVNFKNFSRDIKCFLHDRDGQFFIDNFKEMTENRDNFFFDYEVDDDESLMRVIWVDKTCKRNYEAFGDAVSYDPTYGTNKYKMVFTPFTGVDNHKCSVTFGGALIAKEDYESFNWVFARFLKAMGGKEPQYIITDQDPGIIKSVPLNFKTAQHRFCMWHLMNKLPVKYGSTKSDYEAFLKKLNKIVWDEEMEKDEFDIRWTEIMEAHEPAHKEWFVDIFSIRNKWVMAHCRDIRMCGVMRTTQRSESINSFFKRYVVKTSTLVEFWMRFESAMDSQRFHQKKFDSESRHSTHKLISQLPIEKHGAKVYTNEAFLMFQEEVHYSMSSCTVRGFTVEDGFEITKVKDNSRDKIFEVTCRQGTSEAQCSCTMFERLGLLCRHVLWMYSGNGIKQIPDNYIVRRWENTPLRQQAFTEDLNGTSGNNIQMTQVWSEFHETISVLQGKDSTVIDSFCAYIRDFRATLDIPSEPKDKNHELEQLLGCKTRPEVHILPSKHSKNKGSGKRLVSMRTRSIEKAKKPKRKCNYCNILCRHDIRNCPLKKAGLPPPNADVIDDDNADETDDDNVDDEGSDKIRQNVWDVLMS